MQKGLVRHLLPEVRQGQLHETRLKVLDHGHTANYLSTSKKGVFQKESYIRCVHTIQIKIIKNERN